MHNDFGERTEKKDSLASGNTRHYYYNDNWQLLCDYSTSTTLYRLFVYGNYIDEVLMINSSTGLIPAKLYVHDHLYSPAALLTRSTGAVYERYEYDAYGKCYIMDASYYPRSISAYGNPFYFTGREMDFLDNANLKIMNYRHRYYDTYTGRFSTHDPLGINPAGGTQNYFFVINQYEDNLNLYEYAQSNPIRYTDAFGFWGEDVHERGTINWANEVGYKYGGCAEIIGHRCIAVDYYRSGTAPRPLIGDFSYHFEPGREQRFIEHRNNARGILKSPKISYGDVQRGLLELGIALHPKQDSFSHIARHEAETPWHHAPSYYCALARSGLWHEPEPGWCDRERIHNDNWNDPDIPDYIINWPDDYADARNESKAILGEFLKYPCVCARCKLGLRW